MVTESDKKKFVASSAFIKKDNKKEVESNANKDFLFSVAKFLQKEKPKDSLTVSTDAEIERVDNNDKIILQNIQKDNFSQIKVKNNSIKNKIETKYLKTTSSDKKDSKQKSDILLTTIEESESKSSTMHHLEPEMKEDPLSNEKLKTRPSETTSEPTSIKKNNSNNVSIINKQINKAHSEKKLAKKTKNNPFMNSLQSSNNTPSQLFSNILSKNEKNNFQKTSINQNIPHAYSPLSNTNLSNASLNNAKSLNNGKLEITNSNKDLNKNNANNRPNFLFMNKQEMKQNQITNQNHKIPNYLKNSGQMQTSVSTLTNQNNFNKPNSLISLASNYQKNTDDLFFKNSGALESNKNNFYTNNRNNIQNNLMDSIRKNNQYNTNSTSYSTGKNISFNNSYGFGKKNEGESQDRGIQFQNNNRNSLLGSSSFLSSKINSIQNETNINYGTGTGSSNWNREANTDFLIKDETKSYYNRSNRQFDNQDRSLIGNRSNFFLKIFSFFRLKSRYFWSTNKYERY